MKAAILVVSALLCTVACNKREAAEAKARETAQEASKENKEAAEANQKAAQAAQEARAAEGKPALDPSVDKNGDGVVDEGVTRNKDGRLIDKDGKVIDGATPPMKKIETEVRQTTRDIGKGVDHVEDAALGETPGDQGKTASDKKVTKRVRDALKADKNIAGEISDVNISTVNGKVNLLGSVATPEISKKIARIAGRVPGAKKVDNDLKVPERVGAGAAE
jgi:osmotically-inducible protein OsmY